MKTIAIGADDAAIDLKNIIKKLLEEQDYQVTDYSNDAQNDRPMYPDVAFALLRRCSKSSLSAAFCCVAPALASRLLPIKWKACAPRSAMTPSPPSARAKVTMRS